MKILLISPFIPYPLDSGGNQAFFNMINYLRMHHDLSFVINCHSDNDTCKIEELNKLLDNVTFYIYDERVNVPDANPQDNVVVKPALGYRLLSAANRSLTRKINRRTIKMLSPQSAAPEAELSSESAVAEIFDLDYNIRAHRSVYESFGVYSAGYMNHIWEVSRMGFDVVQLEFYYCLPMVHLLPDNVKKVFVHHEIRFVRNENEFNLLSEPTLSEKFDVLIDKDREFSTLRHFDEIIVLTEVDKVVLGNFLKTQNIYVSPAVLSSNSKEISFTPTKKDLVFLGSGQHFPNNDAVSWFNKCVAPIIIEKGVEFTLYIASDWSDELKSSIMKECPYVQFTGFIDDIQEFLNGKISIVPIRIGSGMRIKILDAINANSVFVTTSKGVEGLDFRDNEECLISDTAEDFAQSIISLLSNPESQERLAESAKKRFSDMLSAEKLLKRRLDFYDSLN